MKSEMRRQFIHFLTGSFLLIILLTDGFNFTFFITAILLVSGVALALLIMNNVHVPFLYDIVRKVEREHETHLPGLGALMFFASSFLLMVLFKDINVVIGALIVYTFGDGIASVIGMQYGRHKIGNRSLEGTVAGIIFSIFILFSFFPLQIAVPVAVIGMLAEHIPVIDDVFTIPFASAYVLTLLL